MKFKWNKSFWSYIITSWTNARDKSLLLLQQILKQLCHCPACDPCKIQILAIQSQNKWNNYHKHKFIQFEIVILSNSHWR